MPKQHSPRKGSMQVWPRRRAKRAYKRVRSWGTLKEAVPLGFAGYKAGMTHLIITDNRKTSATTGMQITVPVTVIECPPMKVHAIRGFKKDDYGLNASVEVAVKPDKDLKRKIPDSKKEGKLDDIKPEEFAEFRLIVHTQPRLTGMGKKKPEIFELGLGGKPEEQFEYAKNVIGKELHVNDLFKAGEQVDIHAVTKGKGFQGPMKRFGVKRTSHKSEKSIRNPGSLGGWKGHGGWMYRVAKAGKMGFHNRVDYNKWVLDIGSDPKAINIAGGYVRYGNIKNSYVLIKGSVLGATTRLIKFTKAIKPNSKTPTDAPTIEHVSLSSNQGR